MLLGGKLLRSEEGGGEGGMGHPRRILAPDSAAGRSGRGAACPPGARSPEGGSVAVQIGAHLPSPDHTEKLSGAFPQHPLERSVASYTTIHVCHDQLILGSHHYRRAGAVFQSKSTEGVLHSQGLWMGPSSRQIWCHAPLTKFPLW